MGKGPRIRSFHLRALSLPYRWTSRIAGPRLKPGSDPGLVRYRRTHRLGSQTGSTFALEHPAGLVCCIRLRLVLISVKSSLGNEGCYTLFQDITGVITERSISIWTGSHPGISPYVNWAGNAETVSGSKRSDPHPAIRIMIQRGRPRNNISNDAVESKCLRPCFYLAFFACYR